MTFGYVVLRQVSSRARRSGWPNRGEDDQILTLAVHETLTYAARLRLPPDLSRKTIAQIVEQVIDELGLRDAADTVVGGPLRKGISGGEKRSAGPPRWIEWRNVELTMPGGSPSVVSW